MRSSQLHMGPAMLLRERLAGLGVGSSEARQQQGTERPHRQGDRNQIAGRCRVSPQPAAGRYTPPRTCQGSLRDPYGQTLDRTSPAQIPAATGLGGGVVGRQNHVRLRSHRQGAGFQRLAPVMGPRSATGRAKRPESLGALPSRPRSCRPAPHRSRGNAAA